MGNVIQGFCAKGQLDLARKQYEEAKKFIKKFIKRYGDEQPELEVFITPTTLLNAYLKAGKIKEAFKLFREENKDLRRRVKTKEPELGDACLAFSKVNENDVWKLFEEAEKFAEKSGEKQSQQWLLEGIAFFCYASISSDYTRKLYEGAKKSIERYGDDELRRRRGQDLIHAYANVLKPDQAFKLFHEAYRDLAEMYEDKELQEACLAFSEVNDVWKLYEEAKKLAEKYRDKQLQRQFLNVIAAFCGESIIYYSKTGKIDKAQVLYDDLKQLVETHGERQPELWVRQAKGAVNLIYTYVTANKPDEAQAVYGELRKLAEDDPDESRLRVWQAKGAFDLT
jgi:tetratricopeptide (TPR) repeat protein